ncbi:UvrD-helicase domain-containing protein [Geitlerinema sp. PCC 7407]|uniref:UvrD-helicase domain-containing protein n=1 Tax=Geitlerinema sp. PCC 7407 TaxID=1173025 RepID=UPI00029FCDAA|nr:ATP-dependent helicase [Geitlerinema sp. PCC 7407]AFY67265.1 UvrD/REP helicase [Geitlerinema sp. PCC 7407]
MISFEAYKNLIRETLNRDLEGNSAQHDGVGHESNDVLMLVAGPGSGKTTVLVLRALRHVLVDDILPEHILITTFTKKAAKELRTRWLDWGNAFLNALSANPHFQERIHQLDLNRCRIDTLDSIAQQALTENRLPGELAPVVAEGATSKLLLKRFSFRSVYDMHQNELDELFSRYTFEGDPPRNRGEALSVAKTLCERLVQDLVNLQSFSGDSSAHQYIVDILTAYQTRLRETNLFDFAFLELELLQRLRNVTLCEWSSDIQALLIDEYQDTNPLQEAIYFEIISASAPVVTMVGDDDQSMYRFRGGSVELFTQFGERCSDATGRQTRRIDMVANYRSFDEIVDFYNRHITGDPNFNSARISPPKPEVISQRGSGGMPVLGLFRANPNDLAVSLASWLSQLFTERSLTISRGEERYELNVTPEGDLGDCVLLAHSVEEAKYKYNRQQRIGETETRFAGLFRDGMLDEGLQIFNPRGRALRTITSVQQILGLLLLCLDPDGDLVDQVFPTNEARFFLNEWKNRANTLIAQNPYPSDNGGLGNFVQTWQRVSRGNINPDFPPDWPVLELIFKLIAWMPSFQNDPEHQVWLEAITRTVSSAGIASPYGMKILQNGSHCRLSRQSFIRDALLPIAEDEVDVDEDIMPSVPRNYLQLMTIHQSKGLEFPLVIVDVGSHFTRNHHKQAFRRFPQNSSNVVVMEDDVEAHLASPLRGGRDPLDRSFDDLVRLYYVAYSRPQSVLILVGCESCLTYGRGAQFSGSIPNVALGWNRDGTWPWRQPFAGRRRPIQVEPPLLLI